MPCYAFQGIVPVVDPTSFVHPLASLVGDVIVGPECYIGPGASLRGDFGRIVIEGQCSIQDNATVHVSSERDTLIRAGATIAHGAVIHGCEIGEDVLVGINAVVLDRAIVEKQSLVAALATVGFGTAAPPRSLLAGNPAAIVRTFAEEEIAWGRGVDDSYARLTREALASLAETTPLPAPESDRARTTIKAAPVRPRKLFS